MYCVAFLVDDVCVSLLICLFICLSESLKFVVLLINFGLLVWIPAILYFAVLYHSFCGRYFIWYYMLWVSDIEYDLWMYGIEFLELGYYVLLYFVDLLCIVWFLLRFVFQYVCLSVCLAVRAWFWCTLADLLLYCFGFLVYCMICQCIVWVWPRDCFLCFNIVKGCCSWTYGDQFLIDGVSNTSLGVEKSSKMMSCTVFLHILCLSLSHEWFLCLNIVKGSWSWTDGNQFLIDGVSKTSFWRWENDKLMSRTVLVYISCLSVCHDWFLCFNIVKGNWSWAGDNQFLTDGVSI